MRLVKGSCGGACRPRRRRWRCRAPKGPIATTNVARSVTARLTPIQQQINPEQLQAVSDILAHKHGAVPYLVFGPPGTGKT